MEIESEYVMQMGRLIRNQNINLDDKVVLHKKYLEKNCADMNKFLRCGMQMDVSEGYEPLPFYCSRRDKKANMVWVGLNPGKRLKKHLRIDGDTATWQNVVDYCIPKDLMNGKNVYNDLLNGGNLTNNYFIFMLRVYMALIGVSEYTGGTWENVKEKCAANNISTGELFKKIIYDYPIINAELVPYKSPGISFSSKVLINKDEYCEYFKGILKIIAKYSNDDAWVIFYGAREDIIRLFQKNAPDWNIDNRVVEHFKPKDSSFKIYVFEKGDRKIVLLPFFRINGFDIIPLVDRIKEALVKYEQKEKKS